MTAARQLLVDCPRGPFVVPAEDAAGGPLQLSVVIPTFNEHKTIEALIRQVAELLGRELGDGYEIIVVDDDSPDRTWELAAGLTAMYHALRVVRRRGERGLSTAVIRGW